MKVVSGNTIPFKATPEEQANIDFLLKVANSSDKTLEKQAKIKAVDEFQRSKARKIENKYSNWYPVIDSVLTGAATKGTLGDKAGSTIVNGIIWGVWIGSVNTIQKIQSAIVNKIPPLKRFSDDHPFISSVSGAIMPIGGGVGAIYATYKGLNRILANPKAANAISKAKEIIDKPESSKKIAEFLNKHTKTLHLATGLAAVGLIVAAISHCIGLSKINKNTEKNLNEYKDLRYEAAKTSANLLKEENTRLAS